MLRNPHPTSTRTLVQGACGGDQGLGRGTGQRGHQPKVRVEQVAELGCFILVPLAQGSRLERGRSPGQDRLEVMGPGRVLGDSPPRQLLCDAGPARPLHPHPPRGEWGLLTSGLRLPAPPPRQPQPQGATRAPCSLFTAGRPSPCARGGLTSLRKAPPGPGLAVTTGALLLCYNKPHSSTRSPSCRGGPPCGPLPPLAARLTARLIAGRSATAGPLTPPSPSLSPAPPQSPGTTRPPAPYTNKHRTASGLPTKAVGPDTRPQGSDASTP